MAVKQRFLDVWIVETNVVYREVPFVVVADWAQQGRLLEDDMARPSGTGEWFRLGSRPELAPYLPRAEPLRPQDQAEALEPVQTDFAWKRRTDDEEEDVDMIPLIDVSLVLLIFFMMTATAAVAAATIQTPLAYYSLVSTKPGMLAVGVDCDDNRRPAVYSLGLADKPPDTFHPVSPQERAAMDEAMARLRDPRLSLEERAATYLKMVPPPFLEMLDQRIGQLEGQVEVVIQTDEKLPDGYYMGLLVALSRQGQKVKARFDGVRERVTPP